MNTYRKLILILGMVAMFFVTTNFGLIKSYWWDGSEVAQAKTASDSTWKQKEFIITMWNAAEPGIASYAQIAKEHYNLIPVNYNAQPLNDSIERLEEAKKNGLRVILGNELINPMSLKDPAKLKQLDELIGKVKKYRNLEGYFITDEPTENKLDNYIELVSYLRKKDPGKLMYFNMPPTFALKEQSGISRDQLNRRGIKYPKHLHRVGENNKVVMSYLSYLKKILSIIKPDLISYDHYPFFGSANSTEYFLNLALISQASKESNKPFLNIIQASRYLKVWRLPTTKEMRFQIYTTLAYGGKGISYFVYWGSAEEESLYRNGIASPLANSLSSINLELRRIGSTLMPLDLKGVYHTTPIPYGGQEIPQSSPVRILSKSEVLVSMFGKGKKNNIFLIVNRSYINKQDVEVGLKINGEKIQELNRKTGEWVFVGKLKANRKFDLTLEAGDGRLFRVI
jgi:hypothetical protein